jgi:hypothetical protein
MNISSPIGVMGCLTSLPSTFPISTPENSGNMIHANAPLNMFPNSFHSKDPRISTSSDKSFRPFVNNSCSHLIVTMANTLVLGRTDGANYARFQKALEQYNKPIVVFGLGVQANGYDLDSAFLPKEAIELIQFLSSKAELLGVRGEYTKKVLEKLCGVKNAYVTGCPSLFSRPEMLLKLRENLKEPLTGRSAVNVTNLLRSDERRILQSAIDKNYYLVEPVSKVSHQTHLDALSTNLDFHLPSNIKKIYENYSDLGSLSTKVRQYFQSYYRLFRSVEPWYQFNEEYVSHSYGTRFHVNMASILSGVPALWVTHDARTRELTDFLHLPSVPLADVPDMNDVEIKKSLDYEDFFDNISGLFDNFNNYLDLNGLPKISNPL